MVKAGETVLKQLDVEEAALGFPKDAAFCGRVYVFIVVDSENDITEAMESNNHMMKQITLYCPEGKGICLNCCVTFKE